MCNQTTFSLLAIVVVIIGILIKVNVIDLSEYSMSAPLDSHIGEIHVQSIEELSKTYKNKRAIIIGGTRGVGSGIGKDLF